MQSKRLQTLLHHNDEGDSVNGLNPADDYVIINYTNMDLDGDV